MGFVVCSVFSYAGFMSGKLEEMQALDSHLIINIPMNTCWQAELTLYDLK